MTTTQTPKSLADFRRILAAPGTTLTLIRHETQAGEQPARDLLPSHPFGNVAREVAKVQTQRVALTSHRADGTTTESWFDLGKSSEWGFENGVATRYTGYTSNGILHLDVMAYRISHVRDLATVYVLASEDPASESRVFLSETDLDVVENEFYTLRRDQPDHSHAVIAYSHDPAVFATPADLHAQLAVIANANRMGVGAILAHVAVPVTAAPAPHDSECGTCHRTWNSTETPTPAARCPFEHYHLLAPDDDDEPRAYTDAELGALARDLLADGNEDDETILAHLRIALTEPPVIDEPAAPADALPADLAYAEWEPDTAAYAAFGRTVAAMLGANTEWDSAADYLEAFADLARNGMGVRFDLSSEEALTRWRAVADRLGVDHDGDAEDDAPAENVVRVEYETTVRRSSDDRPYIGSRAYQRFALMLREQAGLDGSTATDLSVRLLETAMTQAQVTGSVAATYTESGPRPYEYRAIVHMR